MEHQQKAPQEFRNVANFLRSGKAGLKTRVGVYNGKRTDYFKGSSAVKALLSPAYAKVKNAPKVKDEAEATALLNSMIPYVFYLRVDRTAASGNSKQLNINPQQMFQATDYYAWFYEGSQLATYLGGIGLVTVLLAGVMFPLWPVPLRIGVWYLSMGVLGLLGVFIAIAIVRLIFYVITVLTVPPGIWIFPKLFADVGVIESFIPFWEWDYPKKKKARKGKAEEGSTKGKGKGKARADGDEKPAESQATNGGAFIEEVETSGDSRPVSRNARVEDAPDDE